MGRRTIATSNSLLEKAAQEEEARMHAGHSKQPEDSNIYPDLPGTVTPLNSSK